jgi:glycosyltransferase involved in cell wall biosynthesis
VYSNIKECDVKEGYWYKPNVLVDIFHMHWPDAIFSTDNKYLIIPKLLIFISSLLIMKFFGVKLVWTVHNLAPHSKKMQFIHERYYNFLYWLCDGFICLSEATMNSVVSMGVGSDKVVVIKHPEYRCYYDRYFNSELVSSGESGKLKMLAFGQIRRNKCIHECIKLLAIDNVEIIIAGQVVEEEAYEMIQREKNKYSGFLDRLEEHYCWVDDVMLVELLNEVDVVLLPYESITNSGVLLLALSFGKKVIVQDNDDFRLLVDDFDVDIKLLEFKDIKVFEALLADEKWLNTPTILPDEYYAKTVGDSHSEFYIDLLG